MFKKSLLTTAIVIGLSTSPFMYSAEANSPIIENKSNDQVNDVKTSIEERLMMLELSVVGTTPEETLNNFAKAVKTRNGAMQYALFAEEARMGLKKAMENSHWVTGVSSPWVEAYQIISQNKTENDTMEYVIVFDLYTSTGYAGKDQARVTLKEINGHWYITALGPATEKSVGIWNTHESVNVTDLKNNIEQMKTYKSSLGISIQLPSSVMNSLKIEDSTCKNEEGNPPCTHFYYKDKKQNKDVLLMTLLRLTPEQEKSNYYKEHPFLTSVGANDKGSYYFVLSSEHPYGENENSEEGKEWNYLVSVVKERIKSIAVE